MAQNIPTIRRSGTGLQIENGVGKMIATISEDNIYTHGYLTTDELGVVHLVATNFDLFYENVIEE